MEVCGNGMCQGNEPTTCPQDCMQANMCGNGQCDASETTATCPGDCPPPSGINCQDQNVLLACTLCIAGLGCTGVTATECQACLMP